MRPMFRIRDLRGWLTVALGEFSGVYFLCRYFYPLGSWGVLILLEVENFLLVIFPALFLFLFLLRDVMMAMLYYVALELGRLGEVLWGEVSLLACASHS